MKYDSATKCISPELSRDIATLVLGEKPDLEPISESLPADERRADFLAKIAGDEESIIHIEFQTRYDSRMPVRMLTYYARILDRYGLPVYPVVVYLAKTSVPIETTYSSHVRNKHVIAFNYDVIKVWELKSKMVFKNKLAGLYALAPLMPDADLNECRERMIEAIRENLISQNAYMCMATFASLIHPKEMVKNMIQDKLLKESPFYRDVLEEGREEGREEGKEEGRGEGMEKTIIAALAARFGSVSDRLSERVHNIRERNSALFDEMIKLAVTAKDIGEFERKLDKMA
jgi:predicted transposase YdaD